LSGDGRVLVNGAFLAHAPTGVQRHAWEILERLPAHGIQPVLLAPRSLVVHDGYGPAAGGVRRYRNGRPQVWQQLTLPRAARRGDILWTPSGLAAVAAGRQVVTMHDLSMLDHPEWFSPAYSWAYRLLAPIALRRALHVFTSSRFSQQRIHDRLGVPLSRITPVASAASARVSLEAAGPPDERAAIRARYGLPARYILAVGSVEPRKNLLRLLEAAAVVRQRDAEIHLAIVGGQQRIYRSAGMSARQEGLIMLGYVPDEHLGAIYEGARVFVYPSLYEGFGIPPLEAMACGAPVVTSATTSLPEVVGDAAILVDPLDPTSIAEGIQVALGDSDVRARLVAAGHVQAKRFSWDCSASQVAAVFTRLLAADAPGAEPI
jgi:glycosyltransferase involved in cell wall biosynthesis